MFSSRAWSCLNHEQDSYEVNALAYVIYYLQKLIFPLQDAEASQVYVLLLRDSQVKLNSSGLHFLDILLNTLGEWDADSEVTPLPSIISLSRSNMTASIPLEPLLLVNDMEWAKLVHQSVSTLGCQHLVAPAPTDTTLTLFCDEKQMCDGNALLFHPKAIQTLLHPNFKWQSTKWAEAMKQLFRHMLETATPQEWYPLLATDPPIFWETTTKYHASGSLIADFGVTLHEKLTVDVKELWLLPVKEMGLSNRFNLIVIGMFFAHHAGIPVTIWWEPSPECPCLFHDVFHNWDDHLPDWLNVPKVIVVNSAPPQPMPPWKGHDPHVIRWDFFLMAKAAIPAIISEFQVACERNRIPQFRKWDDNVDDFLQLCCTPNQDVEHRASNFVKQSFSSCKTFGFHIRRGNLTKMLQRHCKKQGYDVGVSDATIWSYLQNICKAKQQTRAYIACDVEATYDQIQQWISVHQWPADRIVFNPIHKGGWNAEGGKLQGDLNTIRETDQSSFMFDMVVIAKMDNLIYSCESTVKSLLFALATHKVNKCLFQSVATTGQIEPKALRKDWLPKVGVQIQEAVERCMVELTMFSGACPRWLNLHPELQQCLREIPDRTLEALHGQITSMFAQLKPSGAWFCFGRTVGNHLNYIQTWKERHKLYKDLARRTHGKDQETRPPTGFLRDFLWYPLQRWSRIHGRRVFLSFYDQVYCLKPTVFQQPLTECFSKSDIERISCLEKHKWEE